MTNINQVLEDPSFSGNLSLSFLIKSMGLFFAYLFIPLIGAGGGLLIDHNK